MNTPGESTFGPSRLESIRQELKPILALLQKARSHSLCNNHHMARADLQVALAKYETIMPVLNRMLEERTTNFDANSG